MRNIKNVIAVLGATCFVVGMQGFALGGFSGQVAPDASSITNLGVGPVRNALFLVAGWGLVALSRSIARARRGAGRSSG